MKLRLQCAFDLRRCRSAFFVERSSRRDMHQLERQKTDEQHQWDRESKTFKEIKHCVVRDQRTVVSGWSADRGPWSVVRGEDARGRATSHSDLGFEDRDFALTL